MSAVRDLDFKFQGVFHHPVIASFSHTIPICSVFCMIMITYKDFISEMRIWLISFMKFD